MNQENYDHNGRSFVDKTSQLERMKAAYYKNKESSMVISPKTIDFEFSLEGKVKGQKEFKTSPKTLKNPPKTRSNTFKKSKKKVVTPKSLPKPRATKSTILKAAALKPVKLSSDAGKRIERTIHVGDRIASRKTSENRAKSEWKSTTMSHKSRATQLERELKSIEFGTNEWKDIDESKSKEIKILVHKYKQLQSSIQGLSELAKLVEESNETVEPETCKLLQETLDRVEIEINKYKSSQRVVYEELMISERDLSLQIESQARVFKIWDEPERVQSEIEGLMLEIEKERIENETETAVQQEESLTINVQRSISTSPSTPITIGTPITPSISTTHTTLPPEVEAFDCFISKHGRYGGWKSQDHEIFLSLRATTTNDTNKKWMERAALEIPNMSVIEVLKHEDWYILYQELLEDKKAAIQAWKENRVKTKAFGREKELEVISFASGKQSAARKSLKEKLEKQQKLEEWKTKRDRERAKKEDEAARKREEADILAKSRLETKRKMNQKALAEYRSRKETEKRLNQVIQEADHALTTRLPPSRQQLLARQVEQEAKIAAKREARRRAESIEAAAKKARLSKLASKVSSKLTVKRDPSRLRSDTATIERRKKDTSRARPSFTGYTPPLKLGKVSWRQGL